jgi:hypothetical protein
VVLLALAPPAPVVVVPLLLVAPLALAPPVPELESPHPAAARAPVKRATDTKSLCVLCGSFMAVLREVIGSQ